MIPSPAKFKYSSLRMALVATPKAIHPTAFARRRPLHLCFLAFILRHRHH